MRETVVWARILWRGQGKKGLSVGNLQGCWVEINHVSHPGLEEHL